MPPSRKEAPLGSLRQLDDGGDPMGTRPRRAAGTLHKARRHEAIREIQAAVARELARQCEAPKTVPARIADLLRELHRRLRKQP
jgi:hypothetical protein